MKKILIILTGVLLVWNEPVIAKNEITGIEIAKKVSKAKKEKNTKNAKKIPSKGKKKVVSKKKVTKKKVYKSKKKKKVYKQTTRIKYNVGEIQSYAHQLVREYDWSEEDYQALVLLWYRESSWNPNAVNKKSGACGLGQAYPCSKATKGTDYRTNWRTQVRWGLNYIKKRYGTPREAWKHSQDIGWY